MNLNKTYLIKPCQIAALLMISGLLISCGKEVKNIPFLGPVRDVDTSTPGTSYNSIDLFQAVKRNDIDMLNDVVKSGVSINSIENGESALTLAIKEDYKRMAAAIVDLGINVRLVSSNGETPLTMSFKKNFTTLSLKILEKDNDFKNGEELFIIAFSQRNLTLIKKIMSLRDINLAYININENLYQVLLDDPDITQEELFKFAELFYQRGADINKLTSIGQTLLTHVLLFNQEDFAKFLLSKNADINQVDSEGKTALHWSITQQYINIDNIHFLLNRKINKKIKDQRKKNACDYARMIESKDTRKEVKKLLKCFPYIF